MESEPIKSPAPRARRWSVCKKCRKSTLKARVDARFCSDLCRSRFHNAEIVAWRKAQRARELGERVGREIADKIYPLDSENNPLASL